ncbi:MAG: deaminase [Solirubrobacteraceae bacterium]
MSAAVIAYIPVLHEGYRRFLSAHASGGRVFILGPELCAVLGPLAKDIRALDPALVASSIAAWGIAAETTVIDAAGARALARETPAPAIVMPAEDISYQLVDRYFERCPVTYDSVFLRWDSTRSARLLPPRPARRLDMGEGGGVEELAALAAGEAALSIDWWRRVGAAMRLADGRVLSAHNQHLPDPQSPYAVGDPRANFHRGLQIELSTAVHAEAALIARAARDGLPTRGATIYVTDFPCPPCAKLIAGAGVVTLYYREGYALLDGQDVLERAGVELVGLTE